MTKLLIFTLGGCLAGLFSWLLFYSLLDSSQLFQNFAITSITVFLTFCILKIVSNIRFSFSGKGLLAISFFLIMVGVCFLATFNSAIYLHPLSPTQKISKTFLQLAREKVQFNSPVHLVATANTSIAYINRFNWNEKVYTPCAVLKKGDPSIIGLSITGDQTLRIGHENLWDKNFEQLVKATPFIKYLDESGVNIYDSATINTYRVEFIKKYKIKYLVASRKYIVPANLRQHLTADSVSDKYSDICLYVLDL